MNIKERKKNICGEYRARPVNKAGSFTVICEPIAYTIWDPQHLTILQVQIMMYIKKIICLGFQ
jgi:hypothetical protein